VKRILNIFLFLCPAIFWGQGSDDCSSASVLCANQGQSGTTVGATTNVCPGCSDGATNAGNFCFSLENTVWYSFLTNDQGGDANISISNIICQNGTGQSNAIDAVILEAATPCDESTYSAVSNCVSGASNDFILSAQNLSPNTTYYVLVDSDISGAFTDTSECAFEIQISGSAVEINMEAGPDATIFIGESHDLIGSGPNGSVWSPDVAITNINSTSPTVTPSSTTTYFYSYTNDDGCVYQEDALVQVLQNLYITNTLTPNDDGINDFWEIGNITAYPAAVVEVFDRWGQRVFNTVGYESSKRWDGTFLGAKLPPGTYFYSIDLNTSSDQDVFSGYVTIIR